MFIVLNGRVKRFGHFFCIASKQFVLSLFVFTNIFIKFAASIIKQTF